MRKRHILLSVLLRACLKITFRQMCVILWQNPNAGGVAGCVEQIRAGYTAKVGTRFTAADGGNEFQARSRTVTKGWGCKMRFIGITGGIGAGKSEILHYIGQHCRCEIYLADEVAHLVKAPGTKAYGQLAELLGQEVLGADGEIDRAAMADRIFANPALLEQVNGIIHPAVREFLLEQLARVRESGEAELFFVEAALLIECGYLALVDEMWYIYADEAVRRQRLKASRGYSEEKIARIMSSQLGEAQFRESCDFVIDNSGELAESCRQIDRRLSGLKCRE